MKELNQRISSCFTFMLDRIVTNCPRCNSVATQTWFLLVIFTRILRLVCPEVLLKSWGIRPQLKTERTYEYIQIVIVSIFPSACRKSFGWKRIWPLVQTCMHKLGRSPLQTWLAILFSLIYAEKIINLNHSSLGLLTIGQITQVSIQCWQTKVLHSRPLGWCESL